MVVLLRRDKSHDGYNDVVLAFQDSKGEFFVSLFGGKGDVFTRIVYRDANDDVKRVDFGHPFADVSWTKGDLKKDSFGDYARWKKGVVKHFKELGFDVKLVG